MHMQAIALCKTIKFMLSCEFSNSKDEQIRERIVIGILGKEISQRLQLEADLTLERAIQLARQSEQVKRQSAERVETGVNEGVTESSDVLEVETGQLPQMSDVVIE